MKEKKKVYRITHTNEKEIQLNGIYTMSWYDFHKRGGEICKGNSKYAIFTSDSYVPSVPG